MPSFLDEDDDLPLPGLGNINLSAPGLGTPRTPKFPKPTPDQKKSLLDQFGSAAGSTLGYVADTLDKYTGSKTLRSLLMGRSPLEAFSHFVPDWAADLAGVELAEAPTSTDVLHAAVGKNWTGNPTIDSILEFGGSVAVGILTDPSTAIVGPAKAITAAGKASKLGMMPMLAEGLDKAGAVVKGPLDEVLNLAANPDTVKVLPVSKRFANMDELERAGAKLLGEGVSPIKGASPAQIMEEIDAGLRGAIGIRAPLAVRLGAKALGANIDDAIHVLGAKNPWALATAKFFYQNPISAAVRQVFDSKARGVSQTDALKAADLTEKFFEANREAILVKTAEMKPKLNALNDLFNNALKDFLVKNKSLVEQVTGGVPIETVDNGEFVRALAEFKGVKETKGKLGQLLGEARKTAAIPDSVLQAIHAYDSIVDEMLTIDDYWHRYAKQSGVPNGTLIDFFVRHFPRRSEFGIDEWTSFQRDIHDVPGGTLKVNRASKDPRLTGAKAAAVPLEERLTILENEYGIPRQMQTGKTQKLFRPAEEEMADGRTLHTVRDEEGEQIFHRVDADRLITPGPNLAKVLERLPDDVLESGLFPRAALSDLTDYALAMAHRGSAYSAVIRMMAETAESGGEGVSVKQMLTAGMGPAASGRGRPPITFGADALPAFIKELQAVGKSADDIDSLVVPTAFEKAARKIIHTQGDPKEPLALVRMWDKFLGMFRTGVYTLMPKAQVRNQVSGLWTNFVHAWDDIAESKRALSDTWDVVQHGRGKYLDEYQLFAEDVADIVGALQGKPGDAVPKANEIWDSLRRVKERVASPGSFTSENNPWNPLNVVGTREGYGEAAKKAGKEAESAFLWSGPMEKIGRRVEFINRYSMYTSLRDKGWSPAAAMRQVKLTHYDYGALTEVERNVFKRFAPFYSWSRFNIPAQLRAIVDEPGGVTAQTLRTIATGQEVADAQGEFVPAHLRGGLVIPLKGDNFFSSYGLLPVESAFNWGQTQDGKIDFKTVLESIKAQMPGVATIDQWGTGRQFYSHRPLESVYQWPTDSPGLNYLLSQSPLSGLATVARQATDSRKHPLERAFNLTVGGAKITNVDQEKALTMEARDALKKHLEERPGIKSFQSLYLADPDLADAETMQLMGFLASLNKDAAAAKQKAKPASLR